MTIIYWLTCVFEQIIKLLSKLIDMDKILSGNVLSAIDNNAETAKKVQSISKTFNPR